MEYTVFQFVPTAPCPFLGHQRARLLHTLIRILPSPNKQYLNHMKKKRQNFLRRQKLGAEGAISIPNPTKIHLKENSGEMNGDRSKSQFKTIDLK